MLKLASIKNSLAQSRLLLGLIIAIISGLIVLFIWHVFTTPPPPFVAFIFSYDNLFPYNYTLLVENEGNATISSIPFYISAKGANVSLEVHNSSGNVDITYPYGHLFGSSIYIVAHNMRHGDIGIINVNLNKNANVSITGLKANIHYCVATFYSNYTPVGILRANSSESNKPALLVTLNSSATYIITSNVVLFHICGPYYRGTSIQKFGNCTISETPNYSVRGIIPINSTVPLNLVTPINASYCKELVS